MHETIVQEKHLFEAGCPNGDECMFAHTEEELREIPQDYEEKYHFELHLKREEKGDTLVFRGLEPRLTKRDARAEVAQMCLDALGFEAVNSQYLRKRSAPAQPALAGSDSSNKGDENREHVEKVIQDAIKACRLIIKFPALMAKVQEGKATWLRCLSSTLGQTHPKICEDIKTHFGSVLIFLEQFRTHFKPPKTVPETQVHEKHPQVAQSAVKKPQTNVLEYITSSDPIPVSLACMKQLPRCVEQGDLTHEHICCIVKEAGENGISVVDVRNKLAQAIQLSSTIKVVKLSMYFSSFPAVFQVMEKSDSGAVFRVCWREGSSAGDKDASQRDISRHDMKQEREAAVKGNATPRRGDFHRDVHNDGSGGSDSDVDTELLSALMASAEALHHAHGANKEQEQGSLGEHHDGDSKNVPTYKPKNAGNDPWRTNKSMDSLHEVFTYKKPDTQEVRGTGDSPIADVASKEDTELAGESARKLSGGAGEKHTEASLLEQVEQLQQRVSALEARLKDEETKRLCRLCLKSKPNTVILPCTHAVYCSSCLVTSMRNCPMCAGPIVGKLECSMGFG
jgi:hypothetical protein